MDVAGGRDVEYGLGEMVMHVFLFLLFVVGMIVRNENAWVNMERENTKHGVPGSGSYWHESTVFAGVRAMRSSA